MDIISHGLWGSIAFGRKNRRSFWLAFIFGISPDFFSFGIFSMATFLGISNRPDWGHGLPDPSSIPSYVHTLYNWTHSLLIFIWVFSLVWIILRRPLWEMSAWGFHIIMDIFTHTDKFFPTPFMWPLSGVTFGGISWSNSRIYLPNLGLLIVLYVWYFVYRARRVKFKQNKSSAT